MSPKTTALVFIPMPGTTWTMVPWKNEGGDGPQMVHRRVWRCSTDGVPSSLERLKDGTPWAPFWNHFAPKRRCLVDEQTS